MNIRMKLIASFTAVAMICAAVGAMGYYGLNQTTAALKDVGDVRLPSIQSLLIISEAQTALKVAERTLTRADLSNEIVTDQHKRMEAAWKRVEDAWKIYEPLPQTKDEAEAWKEFVPLWNAWKKDYNDLAEQRAGFRAAGTLKDREVYVLEIALGRNSRSFTAAEDLLNKLLEINTKEGHAQVLNGEKAADTMMILNVVGILIGFFLALGFGIILSRAIANPLIAGVNLAQQLEAGDLRGNVIVNTKDEIGQLGTALNASLKSLNELIGQSTMTVEQVVSGSQQIASASESLSQGASEQAGALEEITSSITEISAQTKQAAANSESANELAKKVMTNAGEGNTRMGEMVAAMEEINKASSNIAKIMKAIDEIAFQTNLLALNAAVEAARAGKYGKGFAVVAEEVRNLATRSATSAKETSEIIELSINKIQAGSQMAKEALKSFQDIVEGIKQSVQLMGEITVSSNEQVRGIVQVEQALQQIDIVTQQNASNAEESAAASSELAGQADLLKTMLRKFSLAEGVLVASGNGHGGHMAAHPGANGGNGNGKGEVQFAKSATKLNLKSTTHHGSPEHSGGAHHTAVLTKGKQPPVISLEDDDFAGI